MNRFKMMMATVWLAAFAVNNGLGESNDEGFIYGKVTTQSGEIYIGIIRWGTQEYFWDDLFNATKRENPWLKYLKNENGEEVEIKIFGFKVITGGNVHQFTTRFGDIKTIKLLDSDEALLTMKNGTKYELSGYGDIGVKLRMYDQNLGKVKLEWKNISLIEFMPTPKKVKREGYRLKGKVIADRMEFEGYIMWDAEECISSDILDGETKDGDMEIEFGNIRSIKRKSSSSCIVKLKDGREFTLRGTNDVNDDNRGIYVEDIKLGKVELSWDEFDEVIFEDEDDSGDKYDAYQPTGRLKGVVTTFKGEKYDGEIVFDLDEGEGFEILDGKKYDMNFYIPFRQIKSIVTKGRYASEITLINGEIILLEDTQDVSDDNDGVLVFQKKAEAMYIEWGEIERIDFK